jgi:tRNA 2-thiouridine synthesizing protein A
MSHKIDLSGVCCPINYVKTKLKLEEIESGELLEVILDDGEPIKNVPSSIRQDGNQIISVEQVDNGWKVVIKKK